MPVREQEPEQKSVPVPVREPQPEQEPERKSVAVSEARGEAPPSGPVGCGTPYGW